MEELTRTSQLPAQSSGYKAPSPKGTNADQPVTAFGGRSLGAPASPYARKDRPEDWERWPQLRKLIAGGLEVSTDWIDVSGSYSIDPNYANIFLLRCRSSGLTLTFSSPEGLPDAAEGSLWENVVRAATITVVVDWLASASGTRSFTLTGVNFPDHTTPEWTTDAGMDVVQVAVWSNGLMLGKDVGFNFGEPV